MCVLRMNVTKNKLYWCHRYLLVQNADSRPDTKYRLQLYQTLRLVYNMSFYSLPSVTQSLFCDPPSWLFALLWNIPGPFLAEIARKIQWIHGVWVNFIDFTWKMFIFRNIYRCKSTILHSLYYSLQRVQISNSSSRNLTPSHTTCDAFMN